MPDSPLRYKEQTKTSHSMLSEISNESKGELNKAMQGLSPLEVKEISLPLDYHGSQCDIEFAKGLVSFSSAA